MRPKLCVILCVSHSFSVQTSKEKLTLASHIYVSGQPLSHCWCTEGQLVHVNFLTSVSCRVLGRHKCEAEAVRCTMCVTLIFSAYQQGKAHSSKACPCHWATCEPLSAPFWCQLVHVNFLAPVSCQVLGRCVCVAEAVRYYAPHSLSVQTSMER